MKSARQLSNWVITNNTDVQVPIMMEDIRRRIEQAILRYHQTRKNEIIEELTEHETIIIL